MITNETIGSWGQLGNQLFQFAFLYGQCRRFNRKAFINRDRPGFDLHPFDITRGDVVRLVSRNEYRHLYRREIVANCLERQFEYDATLAWGPDSCSYTGHFQSERYFIDYADEVRRTFRLDSSTASAAAYWETLIARSTKPVIGIHVRLGDYLSYPTMLTNLQSTSYYERALQVLREELSAGFLPLVFSNDISWCESSGLFADVPAARFVSGLDRFLDLYLMTLCDHHVIANSSFSWWGAWLAGHQNQIVIAPREWFGPAGPRPWNTIYAAGWKILESKAPVSSVD